MTTTQIVESINVAKRALASAKTNLHTLLHETVNGVTRAKDNDDPMWVEWHRICIALMHLNSIDIESKT